MALELGSITAGDLETFKKCEEIFKKLSNTLVQTLDNKKCVVDICPAPIGKGINVTPRQCFALEEIRIINIPEIKWIDIKKDCVFVVTEEITYKINLKPV